jgi:hypothetical protein
MVSETALLLSAASLCDEIRPLVVSSRWHPGKVAGLLQTLQSFITDCLPLNLLGTDPEGGLFSSPGLSPKAVAELTTLTWHLAELLLYPPAEMEVRHSLDETVPAFDLGLLLYEIKVLIQASLLFENRTPCSLSSFPRAFRDLAVVHGGSMFLQQVWHRPLVGLLEPELRNVLLTLIGEFGSSLDFHHADLKRLLWELEAASGVHVCIALRQSEVETRRLLYTFRSLYRGIRYAKGFSVQPLPDGGDEEVRRRNEEFRRFGSFWKKTLATFEFSDVQQKHVLAQIHHSMILPGEPSLYKWMHPAESASPAAIMVSGDGRSDAFLEKVNAMTDSPLGQIYSDPTVSERVREIVFIGAVSIVTEFRTGVDIGKCLFLANPDSHDLARRACALVEIVNRYVLFIKGQCYSHPDSMWLVYCLFDELRKSHGNSQNGRPLTPLTREWTSQLADGNSG